MVVLTIFSAVRDTVRGSRVRDPDGQTASPCRESETVERFLQRLSARTAPAAADCDPGVSLVVGHQFVEPEAQ